MPRNKQINIQTIKRKNKPAKKQANQQEANKQAKLFNSSLKFQLRLLSVSFTDSSITFSLKELRHDILSYLLLGRWKLSLIGRKPLNNNLPG